MSCVRSTSILCLARKTVHNVMRELLFDPRHLYNIFLSRNPPSTHRQQNVSILHNSPRPHPQATKSVNIAQLTTTLSIGNKMCQYCTTHHDSTHRQQNMSILHNSQRLHLQATKCVNIAQLTRTPPTGNKMCQYCTTHHDPTHRQQNVSILHNSPRPHP